MDEVLAQLRSTGICPDNEINKTSFDGMYKYWGKLGHQEQRRKEILEVQRYKRHSNLDVCRGILDLVNNVEKRRKGRYRPSIQVAGFTESATYKNVLMLSEWLVEKPVDFDEDWYVVPCPKGVRTLIVACQGNTTFYSKYGYFRMSCATALPGGNPSDSSQNQCVVLDGFHVSNLNTVYILDLLAWNNQPMTYGETEFRHYWMKTHIEDIPELKTINNKNKITFEILPKVDCSPESFNSFMMTFPHFKDFAPALDGLLFYHKMAHYISGATPLVGWLYPFMVQEVLGNDITVNPGYLMNRPIDYVNQAKYIEDFESKAAKKLKGPKPTRTSALDHQSVQLNNNKTSQEIIICDVIPKPHHINDEPEEDLMDAEFTYLLPKNLFDSEVDLSNMI